jgi:hypothetical protein
MAKIKENGGVCRHYLPMPEEIKNTTSPNSIISEEEYAERVANGTTTEALYDGRVTTHYQTQAQVHALVEKHGAANWYDWAVINWGTKWGDNELNVDDNGDGTILIQYESAWSPLADHILESLFNDIKDCEYIWEEEQGFGEEYHIKNGVGQFIKKWDEPWWMMDKYYEGEKE